MNPTSIEACKLIELPKVNDVRGNLTFVEGNFTGDTFFPPYRHLLEDAGGPFRRTFAERHDAEGGRPAFRFETFVRTDADRD